MKTFNFNFNTFNFRVMIERSEMLRFHSSFPNYENSQLQIIVLCYIVDGANAQMDNTCSMSGIHRDDVDSAKRLRQTFQLFHLIEFDIQ